MHYYAKVKFDGTPLALYRFSRGDGLAWEEGWNAITGKWVTSFVVSAAMAGGDPKLDNFTEERARAFRPAAFA